MKLRTQILQAGKTATGIELPAKMVDALGASERPAVRLTTLGYTYRSTVAVTGARTGQGSQAPTSSSR